MRRYVPLLVLGYLASEVLRGNRAARMDFAVLAALTLLTWGDGPDDGGPTATAPDPAPAPANRLRILVPSSN